jgi:hypothetical protein
MVYLIFGVTAASFSLAIIRDKNAFFSCSVSIKAFSVAFPVSRLILAKAVDRFFVVLSASAKSLV